MSLELSKRVLEMIGRYAWLALAAVPLSLATAQDDVSASSGETQASEPFRLNVVEGESIELVNNDDAVVWRFVFGTERTHAYFHPISPNGGDSLTADKPGDHVHHHGLWFCWKYINKVNFWEHAQGTDRPAGRTEWDIVKVLAREDNSARIELAVRYVMPDGEVALREKRVIEVSPPHADGFTIDWSGSFVAEAEEVVIDRTPLPGEPGGWVFGGYAGLSARLVQLANRDASTLQGDVEFNQSDRFRGKSNGFDYSGEVNGEEVGIAILSDPANLNAPSPWYAIRTNVMSFFTPAVICYGPVSLKRGESFDLNYRILVHTEKWKTEDLDEAYKTYTAMLADDKTSDYESKERDR